MSVDSWPSRNVEWYKLKPRDEVEERDNVFVMHRGGIPHAVICWGSQDAVEAQDALQNISFAYCATVHCSIRVGSLGELCATCLSEHAR